jgi:hypothetical protein
MLIPVFYAGLNAGDELFEHSQLISQRRRASGKSAFGKEPLIDGILHIGASDVLRLRIIQRLLQLKILAAEAVDLFLH